MNYITTKDDFISFLLTYLAEADYRVSDEEKTVILRHVTKEKYEQIKRSLDSKSDFECLEIISACANDFLPSLESKNELIAEMELLYAVDKKKSVLERNMILALKKILLNPS